MDNSSILFSIIIPTFNEEDYILKCIDSIKSNSTEAEIIIADGGSSDKTIEIAKNAGCTITSNPRGRGTQLNDGADYANGEILIFLHADSQLSNNALDIINKYFIEKNNKVGTFRVKFDTNKLSHKLIEFTSRFDSVFTSFGDQGIIVNRNFFYKLNGFPDWSLFEDVKFFQVARKKTSILSIPSHIITSNRRFKENGLLKQKLLNAYLMIQYLFGVSPYKLVKKYKDII